jgi:hypothetical protein
MRIGGEEVASLFRKLGVRSRTEAVMALEAPVNLSAKNFSSPQLYQRERH